MGYWQSVLWAGGMAGTYPWVLFATILLALLVRLLVPAAAGRGRAAMVLALISLPGILLCAMMLQRGVAVDQPAYRWLHFAAQWALAMAIINLAGVLVFRVLLRILRLNAPPILRDAIIGLAYVIVALSLLSRHDVNLTGIVATSAVVTAIIGFSLQDTLGNIMGGVALQMEQSIAVGDWIRIGDVEGLVHEIRWRQTSIETRSWDTIVIPNSVLMKSQVTVVGRRAGKPRQHRMLVNFNVDYRHSPLEVIDAINHALQKERISNVATDPPPGCILKDFLDSYASYIVAYWLIDSSRTESTSSEVRTRIFVALQRAGIPLSIPAQSVFMTLEGRARDQHKRKKEMDRRVAALQQAQIFQPLTDQEREQIADHLAVAPFRRGEVITRQGDRADDLFLIIKGEAEVRYDAQNGSTGRVNGLRHGDVFGEMGLMTGEPRSATVIAATDMLCYRLDQTGFKDALQRRPSLAVDIAELLDNRRIALNATKADVDASAKNARESDSKGELLRKIRDFFRLN